MARTLHFNNIRRASLVCFDWGSVVTMHLGRRFYTRIGVEYGGGTAGGALIATCDTAKCRPPEHNLWIGG